MNFRILGSLEAGAGVAMAELGPPKQRALLAILLLHAGEIVSVDRLIDALWPDRPPRTAAHSIQIYVSELRKALAPYAGGDIITTRAPGYLFLAADDSIDARRFERLVEEGLRALQTGDRPAGAARLRSALTLWRGPALSDFAYEEFAQPYIRRLNDRHLDAIEELAAAELAAGLVPETLSLAEAAVREDPLRERSREILMLALHRSGRHAEALRTYRQLRKLLLEELGLDPSPALQRLQERILLHDPTLAPPPDQAMPVPDRAHNPFKGLRPFTEEDAADFFGREALVERLLDGLRSGARLIALVGPSGSGKSSVVAAGLIPRLRAGAVARSERWTFESIVPDATPRADQWTVPGTGRLLVVIDQFEDLFTGGDEATRRRFLRSLTAGLTEPAGQLTVVLTLRADFYDRPLLDPEFADVFVPAVMNVLPMTSDELEAAVVGPAARAGVTVEPGLLAALLADTVAEPGALPLLQYTLTELFDRNDDATLTLAEYRSLGGLRGILSRRAENVFAGLDDPGRQVAIQLFLRLVRPGRGTIDSRRRLPLSELTDLDVDPVALSEVLDGFGRHRLVSFDRDQTTGDATVEVAHEALLREWDRLAGWIDRHRAALRRHETFGAAAEEWDSAGRDPDYLLSGSRLEEFEGTIREGTLQLTGRELSFLQSSLGRRNTERTAELARTEAHRTLERRARSRLVALAVTVLALAIAAGYGLLGGAGGQRAAVALLYNGDADFAISRIIQGGFDSGVADFGLTSRKSSVVDGPSADAALRKLSEDGAGLIVVSSNETDVDAAAAAFPRTWFVGLSSSAERPNVGSLAFADNEGSFLAGAAAAATSRTGTIGFIGGMDGPVIWSFQAGYEAGARAVDPDITVLTEYLSPSENYDGFLDSKGAAAAAAAQYGAGADVIFAAAGDSGLGLFKVTAERSTAGRPLWAIGVDSDQYDTLRGDPGNLDWRAWTPHILTSVVKRMDTGVYDVLADYAHGTFHPGAVTLGLADHGVDVSYSGGFIEGLRPMIEAWRTKIIAGAIVVPCIPVDRAAHARELGLSVMSCGG